jgi:hypothetical protein
MNRKIAELKHRRGELLARIAAQREQMSTIGADLRTPLALADRGVAAVRYLRNHPLLAAGVLAFVVLHRRGVAALMGRVLGVWKSYRYLTLL